MWRKWKSLLWLRVHICVYIAEECEVRRNNFIRTVLFSYPSHCSTGFKDSIPYTSFSQPFLSHCTLLYPWIWFPFVLTNNHTSILWNVVWFKYVLKFTIFVILLNCSLYKSICWSLTVEYDKKLKREKNNDKFYLSQWKYSLWSTFKYFPLT